ncbi:uncharacterized protein LOC118408689 [Branchiostoma floridae]|uniref:Uncharacterized protein LOC118408689 n=1 Tax=Branchiostoma floridae TaxID=7739 RepID=A0A9J7HTH3_BRAFL|nr:uncharacterized protein LOC118408689 [Branchiostoma floridae]
MPRKKLPSELKTVSALDMTNDYFDDKIKKTFKTRKREQRETELKTDRYNLQAAVTIPASDQPCQHDAGLSTKQKAEEGGFVWVEKGDRLSANSGRGGISSARCNSVGTIQVKSCGDGGLRDQNVVDQMSMLSRGSKVEVPASSQPPADPSIQTSATESPLKTREGRTHVNQAPANNYAPTAGIDQAPGVGNIPVIACQPPVLPQPYQVTNVYNIYSPKNIQIGNQNAMEKDDIVTDGPGFDQPVYYVPPMPYPPEMPAAPRAQGQEKAKTSNGTASKLNKEYDIDDETDVKVPLEPEFDLDDETHVKIPVKPKMQTSLLSPAELARSESCSSADEAQEETCVMSALAEDMAEGLSLNTTDGETSVKEVQDLQTSTEESMVSGASVPKQRKGGILSSFLSRGKKK